MASICLIGSFGKFAAMHLNMIVKMLVNMIVNMHVNILTNIGVDAEVNILVSIPLNMYRFKGWHRKDQYAL